ncbi:MAG: ParB/RepB/Spo0J family partition protein [Alphaproteobacteria bacterium]|nr:ParB/RepB/Spo0J family partition protein [Alphaproteobacteria bacterium]
MKKNKVLGQGLAAILRDIDDQDQSNEFVVNNQKDNINSEYQFLSLNQLTPSPYQPRKVFDEVELSELSASIKRNGVLQPLLVRKVSEGNYEIIAGERRWRAAGKAELSEVPVIVKSITDEEAMIVAFVENLQREDLTALEEAEGLEKLSEAMGQEQIAQMIGKSRSYVANVLRLNKLPEEIKDLLRKNEISAGIARSLVGHPNAIELARLAVKNKLNVRELENLAQKMKVAEKTEAGSSKGKVSASKVLDDDQQEKLATEKAIETALGLKAKLIVGPKTKVLSIYFETMEQLDSLLSKLTT